MGFDASESRLALRSSNGDITMAIGYISKKREVLLSISYVMNRLSIQGCDSQLCLMNRLNLKAFWYVILSPFDRILLDRVRKWTEKDAPVCF